jgi:hypothetical protein
MVSDRSTYQQPTAASVGVRYVIVNGVPVVVNGAVRDACIGTPAAGGRTHGGDDAVGPPRERLRTLISYRPTISCP